MMKILISGASGFVGGALIERLNRRGDTVVQLVRRQPTDTARESTWDPSRSELDPTVLSGADAVINLSGRNISSGRWTDPVKEELRTSRLDATRTIVNAIAGAERPPRLLINASATGIYGDRGDEELDETSAAGSGFLADLASGWEELAAEARSGSTRVVQLRFGMILGDGGALKKMLTPFKLGFGGPIGNGRQFWPWVAMNDVTGVVEHVLDSDTLDGPINVVAPEPVTSRAFGRALGEQLGIPAIVPAPAFAVKLAFGEMAEALLLASTNARPMVLQNSGYRFKARTLSGAFRSILG